MATERGTGILVGFADCAKAVLSNGLGLHDAARDAARRVFEHDYLGYGHLVVPELAEAAARTGDTALVQAALEWLSERTRVTPTEVGARASAVLHVAWVASGDEGPRAARLIGYPEGSCRDFRIRDRRMGYMSSSHRDGIRRAVAAREQGRSKVRSTTTAVTMASVVTAGALALALPGSTHKTSTSSSSTSTGSSPTRFLLDEFRIVELEFRLVRLRLRLAQAPALPAQARLPPTRATPATRIRAASARAPRRRRVRAAARSPPAARDATPRGGHGHGRRRVGQLACPRDAGPAGGDRPAVPGRGPAPADGRPRRGGPGLQPVPRRLGNLRPPDGQGAPGSAQPAAGRGHRGGAAGGQPDRRRRGPDGGRGHVRGRIRS